MHYDRSAVKKLGSLADQQAAFGEALLNPDLPIPDGAVGPGGLPSVRRFNVYRNNVVAGQISTLSDAYPATVRLVGEEFFRAMARDYVLRHPPSSPMMFDYGIDFADFIDGFTPACELPYLGDVARIERAWVEAYHAPESASLSSTSLRSLVESDLGSLRFQLHPSIRMVRSIFPAFTIWKMNTERDAFRTINLEEGDEDVLVGRPESEVHVYRLGKGGAQFFTALRQGLPVVEAVEQALAGEPQFELAVHMDMLLGARLAIGSSSTHRRRPDLKK
jgi:hypothetical protein